MKFEMMSHTLQSDTYGLFTHSMSCPCRSPAVPCRAAKDLECVFPIWFTQCGRVWFTLAMPCHAHVILRPCSSSQGHGTARPSRDGLWATRSLSTSSGYHAEFHEGCHQTHTNLRCRWPMWNQTPFVMDEEKSGSSTLQKKTICYTVGLAVRIFPATMPTSTKDTALSEQDRDAAWHVWIKARHGRGTAWTRHGNGMLCVNRPSLWVTIPDAASIQFNLLMMSIFLLSCLCTIVVYALLCIFCFHSGYPDWGFSVLFPQL